MFDDVRATQTRPRFYVPSERRGATLMSNTQDPHPHWPGIEPGPLAWEADVLTTGLSRLSEGLIEYEGCAVAEKTLVCYKGDVKPLQLTN